MTQHQWDKHNEHMGTHITWPASKQQIIEACAGEDVEKEVMDELQTLADRTYGSEGELKGLLVH